MPLDPIPVPVLGFPPELLADWPADMRPEPLRQDQLDSVALLLVHQDATAEYGNIVAALPADRRPDALLYLAAGAPPRDAWRQFSGVVRPGDWDRLRESLACPHRDELLALVDEIPTESIAAALAMIGNAPYEMGALAALPLPSDVRSALRDQLAMLQPCRAQFARALLARQEWVYRVMHPPVDMLGAYAYGESEDKWVAAHIVSCAACASEVDVLAHLAAAPATPERATLARIELSTLSDFVVARPTTEAAYFAGALVADLSNAGLAPLPVWNSYLGAGPNAPNIAPEGKATLIGDDLELNLRWSDTAGVLQLEDLRGPRGVALGEFSIELRRGAATLWRENSAGGSLPIPLTDISSALADGADTLVILSNIGPG